MDARTFNDKVRGAAGGLVDGWRGRGGGEEPANPAPTPETPARPEVPEAVRAQYQQLNEQIGEAQGRVDNLREQVVEAGRARPAVELPQVPNANAANHILEMHRNIIATPANYEGARDEREYIANQRRDLPLGAPLDFARDGEVVGDGQARAGRAVAEYARLREAQVRAEGTLDPDVRNRLGQVEEYLQLRQRLEGGERLTDDQFNRLNDFERAEIARIAPEIGVDVPGAPQDVRMAADSLQRMREMERAAAGRTMTADEQRAYQAARRGGFNANILARLGNNIAVDYFAEAERPNIQAYIVARDGFNDYIEDLQAIANNRVIPGRLTVELTDEYAAAQDRLRALQDERNQLVVANPGLQEDGMGGGGEDDETQPAAPTTRAEALRQAQDLRRQAREARQAGDIERALELQDQAMDLIIEGLLLPETAPVEENNEEAERTRLENERREQQNSNRKMMVIRGIAIVAGVAGGVAAAAFGGPAAVGLIGVGMFAVKGALWGAKAAITGSRLRKNTEQLARTDITPEERARLTQEKARIERTRRTFDNVQKILGSFTLGFGIAGFGTAAYQEIALGGHSILGGVFGGNGAQEAASQVGGRMTDFLGGQTGGGAVGDVKQVGDVAQKVAEAAGNASEGGKWGAEGAFKAGNTVWESVRDFAMSRGADAAEAIDIANKYSYPVADASGLGRLASGVPLVKGGEALTATPEMMQAITTAASN